MSASDTLDTQLSNIGSTNLIYNENRANWKFLLDSYMGGVDYKQGNYLTRYQLETNAEYAERIRSTPLQNHCKSIISVYNSFMFQDEADREFGVLTDLPEVQAFLEDADLEGRSLDSFMKDVSTWASVFGHSWVVLSKPNVGAITRADEINMGVRPYASVLSPLSVLDWYWKRNAVGHYQLEMLKYVEEVNGDVQTIKQWTPETVTTWEVDFEAKKIHTEIIERNGLGKIPAVIAYASRSPVRGLGVSDITDIADSQKFIYNMISEAEQTIRLDSHPSLVKTPDTVAGNGAGSLINMPENLEPGLKPYLLEYSGGSIDSIYKSIEQSTDAIDMQSNTGSVRAKTAKTLSGIAMQTEFQLLNAKLAEKADNLQLAEEQLWQLFAMYQGYVWDGVIEYPDSFNITDEAQEFANLKTAKDTATDPSVLAVIDNKIMSLLEDDYTLANVQGLTAAQVAEYDAAVEAAEEVTPQVDPGIAISGTAIVA